MDASKPPFLNNNLRWFLLAMILANIAGMMAYSMLSLYLIDLGASVPQVGMVFTIAALVPMILQILGGWISDTIGRLRAIAIGSSIAVFGYLLFFISPTWQWVLVGLCVEYVSNSFVGPSFSAYIAEQSTQETRGRVYGITRGIYMVVTVIGPTLAGFIAYRTNFKSMLLVAFTFYLMATLVRIWMALAARFSSPKKSSPLSFKGFFSQFNSIFVLLIAGGILSWIWITDAIGDTAYNLTGELLPIYLSTYGHLTLEQIGLLGSAWGTASIIGSFAGGWLTDKFSERTIITAGFVFVSAGLATIVMASSPVGYLLARLLHGLGVGLLMPGYDSLVSKVVPEDKRGLAFGFFGTSLGILSLPMPWIGSQLWEHVHPLAPFLITACLCAISIPIAWFKFIQKTEKND